MSTAGFLWLESFGSFIVFVIRTCASAPGAIVHRLGEVIRQFEQVAVRSLPIVVGAGLSVGLVAWLQTHRLLVAHGAEVDVAELSGGGGSGRDRPDPGGAAGRRRGWGRGWPPSWARWS